MRARGILSVMSKEVSWKCDSCNNVNYGTLCSFCEVGWKCKNCLTVNIAYDIHDNTCFWCKTESQARRDKLKSSPWNCEVCNEYNHSSGLCFKCKKGWKCKKCYQINTSTYDALCFFCGAKSQEIQKIIKDNEKLEKITEQKRERLKQLSVLEQNLERNKEIQQTIKSITNTLFYVLEGEGKINLELLRKSNWDIFKNHSEFEKPKPNLYIPPFIFTEPETHESLEPIPEPPQKILIQKPASFLKREPLSSDYKFSYVNTDMGYLISSEPNKSDPVYSYNLEFLDIVFFWRAWEKAERKNSLFKYHHRIYTKELEKLEKRYQNDLKEYNDCLEQYKKDLIHYETSSKEEEIRYIQELSEHNIKCQQIKTRNQQKLKDISEQQLKQQQDSYEQKIAIEQEKYNQALEVWEKEQESFYKDREKLNTTVDLIKQHYTQHAPKAILTYCTKVLSHSVYPNNFPKIYELDFNPETKTLVVDYSLPLIKHLPKIKEVKYLKTNNSHVDILFTEAEINKLYENLLYQITLRTIYELYSIDFAEAILHIIFNGWIKSINKKTGNEETTCILSISVARKEFMNINLANVDVKLCFKSLKGIGGSKLRDLTPVAPLLTISRKDKRFVPSYEIAHTLNSDHNLAAMDWEDFEHLIRELFEKEFSQVGTKVRVTQASRDGGVDAIIFDPDPIRGGKIIIQAKRYTNVVSVSAVRDLYGTIMNEGATKGILVTTAEFGPDSYEFAKGKPISLLNGNNLLHLLDKHGYKAKINLEEAKKILVEQEHKLTRLK